MSANATVESEPRYGWVIVSASAIMLGVGIGMIGNTISVFLKPLEAEFGWQRGSVSFMYFCAVIGLGVGGIVMGRLADRTTTRRVVLLGVVVLGLSLLAMSRSSSLWLFYLLFFVSGALGAGALFTPLIANVGNWFHRNVGLALGVTSAGLALGQGGVPYVAAHLIGVMGWRDALSTMGLISLALLTPLALLIRQPPNRVSTHEASASDDESPVPLAPRTVVLWMSCAVILCCICMSVPLMHLVPLIQDKGFPLDDAAGVLFAVLLAGIFGRIAFGKLADLIGPIRAYWISSCWQTVLVYVFIQFDSLESFYWFAPIYGFGYAGVMTGIIICCRTMTPLSKRAVSLGIVTFFAWLGHGIGGYQGGFFFDLTGDYTISYANAAFAGMLNLIIVGALYYTITRRQTALVSAT